MIEDARARQSAVISLIYFTDVQAVNFLRLYITIAAAAGSGAAAAMGSSLPSKPELIASTMGLFAMMVIASFFCLRAMAPVELSLPGRDGAFWQWGLLEEVNHSHLIGEYLTSVDVGLKNNRTINGASAGALTMAKQVGIAAPVVAILAALVARCSRYLF